MSFIVPAGLVLAGLVLMLITLVLFVEIVVGRSQLSPVEGKMPMIEPRAAVLIPAHNEENGLERTLSSLKPQLGPGDRILVVADNCSDGTADVARRFGVEVTERENLQFRGKGYALAHGLDVLAGDPPDAVIMIDADCTASHGAVAALKAKAVEAQRPIQTLNLMRAPQGHEQRFAVAEFAWRIKNQLRPSGLNRLGLPCQLMGTGMAFPWPLARGTNFASGNIVEDLELGIRMARNGVAPRFFTGATVFSEFPLSVEGEISQRRRWEGGSFSMLLKHGAGTFLSGVAQRNSSLAVLGLDMLVPPLVLHGLGIAAFCAVCIAVYLMSGFALAALLLALAVAGLFFVSIALAWFSHGRDILPFRSLVRLVPFVLAKFRVHRSRQSDWVRADRRKD